MSQNLQWDIETQVSNFILFIYLIFSYFTNKSLKTLCGMITYYTCMLTFVMQSLLPRDCVTSLFRCVCLGADHLTSEGEGELGDLKKIYPASTLVQEKNLCT